MTQDKNDELIANVPRCGTLGGFTGCRSSDCGDAVHALGVSNHCLAISRRATEMARDIAR